MLGRCRLHRAKYKPGRKLSAYFTFPALGVYKQEDHLVHLAVTWQKNTDGHNHADGGISCKRKRTDPV